MSNLRLIAVNDVDSATLSASPAVLSTLPASNLQLPERAKVVRTSSTAAQDIKGTWSAAKVVSGCALVRHNLTSSATWRLRLYSDAAWTTLVYDSGAMVATPAKALGELIWGVEPLGVTVFTGWGQAFSDHYFAPISARSFTLTLTDAANPDGYLQASRLFLGYTLEPEANCDWGLKLSWKESSKLSRTDGGSLRVDPYQPYRTLDFNLNWLTSGDRARFLDVFRAAGRRLDVWISVFPGSGGMLERDHAMQARLTGGGDSTHNRYNNWTQPFQLEEA